MSGEMVPFIFEGHNVRVHVDDAGNPWWVAADACRVLGLSKVSDAVMRLESDEKRDLMSIGEIGTALIINESGLYRLIFRSNKPQAKRFQKWVFSEVIPQIRRTGKYEYPDLVEEAARQKAIQALRDHQELGEIFGVSRHFALTQGVKAARELGVDLSHYLQASPHMDNIQESEMMLEPTELARYLGVRSAIAMNKLLEREGLQIRQGGLWNPTEQAKNMCAKHSWLNNEKSGYNLKWNVAQVSSRLNGYLSHIH